MKSLITTLAALAMLTTTYGASTTEQTKKSATHKKPAAIGERTKMTAEDRFKSLDTNHDNSLTMDEYKAGPLGKRDSKAAEQVFGRKDTNHDGTLTLDEFKARMPKKGEKAPSTTTTEKSEKPE